MQKSISLWLFLCYGQDKKKLLCRVVRVVAPFASRSVLETAVPICNVVQFLDAKRRLWSRAEVI